MVRFCQKIAAILSRHCYKPILDISRSGPTGQSYSVTVSSVCPWSSARTITSWRTPCGLPPMIPLSLHNLPRPGAVPFRFVAHTASPPTHTAQQDGPPCADGEWHEPSRWPRRILWQENPDRRRPVPPLRSNPLSTVVENRDALRFCFSNAF